MLVCAGTFVSFIALKANKKPKKNIQACFRAQAHIHTRTLAHSQAADINVQMKHWRTVWRKACVCSAYVWRVWRVILWWPHLQYISYKTEQCELLIVSLVLHLCDAYRLCHVYLFIFRELFIFWQCKHKGKHNEQENMHTQSKRQKCRRRK